MIDEKIIKAQVQHCLRAYKGERLELKIIDLVKEWYFKGFKFDSNIKINNEE